jgi:hypothetical protein
MPDPLIYLRAMPSIGVKSIRAVLRVSLIRRIRINEREIEDVSTV